MKTKGIFITSLNSKRLQDAIANRNNFHFNNEVDELDTYVFDVYEVLNAVFFNAKDAKDEIGEIERLIEKLEAGFIVMDTSKRELIRCSQKRKDLAPYLIAVQLEYHANSSFEKHCKNQIFQNLQPKLRKLGILNNRAVHLEILVPFLLMELALYLYIFDTKIYDKIYGMEDEMEIVFAIRTLRYSNFNKFIHGNTSYTKIIAE